MQITKEMLVARKENMQAQLVQLQAEINQMTANGNALAGAIQFCEDLISEAAKDDSEKDSGTNLKASEEKKAK